MIKFSFSGVGGRVKAAVCRRDYQTGDIVQVPEGKWTRWSHPIGGIGAWAIYVGKTGDKFKVRPLDRNMQTAATIEVGSLEHIDDVEAKRALAEYRLKNGH